MKLAIMQPYFFPYFGHFSLIASVDKWVVLDITQYTKQSWINRNRILHQDGGWHYITIPVNSLHSNAKIYEAEVLDKNICKKKILGKLLHYRSHAPYFSEVYNIVEKTFKNFESNSLVELNVNSIKYTCEYLDINFNYIISSKEKFLLPNIEHAGQWSLEISSLLGATEYINPPGGKSLFKEEEFSKKNIKLTIQNPPQISYSCRPYNFEPSLSIIDVMMWNSPQTIKSWL